MIVILAGFLVVGIGLVALRNRLGHASFAVAAVASGGASIWFATRLAHVDGGGIDTVSVSWVPGLDLEIGLRLDAMSLTMAMIIVTIGVGVFAYCSRYFAREAPDQGTLAGLLVLFAGGMSGVVLADNIYFLYTCWEVTTIASYFLIGHLHTEARARGAALHALLVTTAGGLAMLGGLVLLAQVTGTTSMHGIVSTTGLSGPAVTVALILVLIGAFAKSAQYPFHAWLPSAMEAPTPVSAYLHSATMVTAGVYVIARFAPLGIGFGFWRPLVVTVGLVSLIAGGLRAIRQVDLKLLLAHGTVSQLGLMVVLFGVGTPAAALAGWMLLVSHAAFKAALFMVVGVLDRATGTRLIGELPEFARNWNPLRIAAAAAVASMAGIPLFAGFIAKESIFESLSSDAIPGSAVILGVVVVGSMLTVAYSLRFYFGAFVEPRGRRGEGLALVTDRPRWLFIAPAVVLALVGVTLGVSPGIVDHFAAVAATTLEFSAPSTHLALWHGFGLPLALTVIAVAGGVAIVYIDRTVQPLLAFGSHSPTGDQFYLDALRALTAIARRITGVVQNGSLPIYLGVILATAAIAPLGAVFLNGDSIRLPAFGSTAELVVVGWLLTAALGAAIVRQRFSAAVFLSVAGYAMAGLFALRGAPDLALTQAAVETLSTVVFVLVLRRLPRRFVRHSTPRRKVVRVAVSIAVGVMVFVFAILAAGTNSSSVVSEEMIRRALPDGHGLNVVNVILVDFRGFDTLGEISVVAVAAIGAVAIARSGRHRALPSDHPSLAVIAEQDARRRIVFVDVSVQLIFHVILMASLWFLFAGHYRPGGGFVGGLLAGAAFTLRYIAGGMTAVKSWSRIPAWSVLGSGLLAAAVTALAPLAWGDGVLEAQTLVWHLGFIGKATLASTLVFDVGVYLVVVGMVLMAFEAFGDRPEEVTA